MKTKQTIKAGDTKQTNKQTNKQNVELGTTLKTSFFTIFFINMETFNKIPKGSKKTNKEKFNDIIKIGYIKGEDEGTKALMPFLDTLEVLKPQANIYSKNDYNLNPGLDCYNHMHKIRSYGFKVFGELGEWPYLFYAKKGDKILEYCEGDITERKL